MGLASLGTGLYFLLTGDETGDGNATQGMPSKSSLQLKTMDISPTPKGAFFLIKGEY